MPPDALTLAAAKRGRPDVDEADELEDEDLGLALEEEDPDELDQEEDDQESEAWNQYVEEFEQEDDDW